MAVAGETIRFVFGTVKVRRRGTNYGATHSSAICNTLFY
jgi:hypothetical protein